VEPRSFLVLGFPLRLRVSVLKIVFRLGFGYLA